MSSAEVPQFVSVEEYLAAEETAFSKSECIDGWVRAMTGATNRHNQVKTNCLFLLMLALKGKRCRPFDSDTKVRIVRQSSTRFYYPDLQVVCEENAPTEVFQATPVLIVEVLSPSTRSYDLDEKLTAYLQIPSLQYYVVPCS
jgi:Uma2 family endonuclease